MKGFACLVASLFALSSAALAQTTDPNALLAGKSCVGKVSTGYTDKPEDNMAGWFIQWGTGSTVDGQLWRVGGKPGYDNPPQALNAGPGKLSTVTRLRAAPNGEIAFYRSDDQDVFLTPVGNGVYTIRTGVNKRYSRAATDSMTCK